MSLRVSGIPSGRRLLGLAFVAGAVCGLAGAVRAQLVFGPPASTPLGGSAALGVAAGDVNGDLHADLVIGHVGAPGLRLGDGNGHFGPEVPIAVGASGPAVLLADVSNDGRPDLFTGSSATGWMHVAICQPDGSFGPAQSHALGPMTPGLDTLAFDVKGAGVLAVTPGIVGVAGGEARIFRSDADGNLELMGVIAPALPSRVVAGQVGFVDADDLPDVALQLDTGTTSPTLSVSVFLGQGGGSFVPTWSLGGATLGRLGDLTAAGNGLDLLTLGSSGGVAAITAHHGVGDGTFVTGPITEIETATGVTISSISDLDQDYINDLVAVREMPAELWILRGTVAGDGSFEMDAQVTLAPASPLLAAGAGLLGDFDEGGGRNNFDAVVPVGLGTAAPSVGVCFNLSYLASHTLLDLGHQLKGTSWPIQIVEGSFVAGQPFAFRLAGAVPSGSALLVVGLSQLGAPFKAGTMVPDPLLIAGPFAVTTSGEVTLAGAAWPGGPSGLQLVTQFWIADPAGPKGFAASSGVEVTLP